MARVVTINTTKAKKLVRELEQFEEIKRQVLKLIPEELIPQGSKLWWEWSDLKGLEEVKKGEYYKLSDQRDLKDFFDHIDDDGYINKFYSKSKKRDSKASKANKKEVSKTAPISF
jgi:hypothetical protein